MISVCICTYNRSESLRRTLESLASQSDISLSEVLIIDNNCTDATAAVIKEFHEKLPIRRVTEKLQGLSHARNRAAAAFQGDVLLFTDDDVRFEVGWLTAYEDAIRCFPDADYFGGRILPDWGSKKPHWIRDAPLALIDGALVWFDHGAQTRWFEPNEELPFGASFAIRRPLFQRIGLFRSDLGPLGKGRGFGDDTEFLMRARDAEARGVYVGKALCLHAHDPRRITLHALYRFGVACGRSHNRVMSRPGRGSYRNAARFVFRGLYQAMLGHGDRFRQCIINAGIQVGTRPGHFSSQ